MYTGAALSFGLIRACRGGLVLYCSVLSDAGGENDGSSAIFERSLWAKDSDNLKLYQVVCESQQRKKLGIACQIMECTRDISQYHLSKNLRKDTP